MTPAIDYPVFDADNHYYEALDAFTRHLDPKLGHRTVQWCEIEGRKYHVVAGRVSHAVSNPTFNPIAMPGVLHDYLRGIDSKKSPVELLRCFQVARMDRSPKPGACRGARSPSASSSNTSAPRT